METTHEPSDFVDASRSGDLDRRLVERLYRAFNEADPDLLDEVLADDWRDTPMAPGQEPGRAGMKPMIAAFRAAFADLRFAPQEIVLADGRAAVRLELSGRHIGEWMGVAATGRGFTIAMHELHHLAEGRITHTWHLEDWAGWARAGRRRLAPAIQDFTASIQGDDPCRSPTTNCPKA